MLDGAFSPDGSAFAATNMSGALIVLGLGAERALQKAPLQQFFASDHNALVHDAHGNALDAHHQQLPHLLPRQPLCDEVSPGVYVAHPDHLQRPAASEPLTFDGLAAEQATLLRQLRQEKRDEELAERSGKTRAADTTDTVHPRDASPPRWMGAAGKAKVKSPAPLFPICGDPISPIYVRNRILFTRWAPWRRPPARESSMEARGSSAARAGGAWACALTRWTTSIW